MRKINRDIVGAFIFSKDNKVLLGNAGVYEASWSVPGGGVEEGETKKQACIREILEETGIDVSKEKMEKLDFTQTGESEKTLRDTGERVLVKMTFDDWKVTLRQNATDVVIRTDDDFVNARWFSAEEIKAADNISKPTLAMLREIKFV